MLCVIIYFCAVSLLMICVVLGNEELALYCTVLIYVSCLDSGDLLEKQKDACIMQRCATYCLCCVLCGG